MNQPIQPDAYRQPSRQPLHTSNILVLLAYLLITIMMTWPTALYITEGIPGDGFDGWQNYWNLWWVKEALLVQGTNPYFTTYLYPPIGTNLLFHTLNIFNGLWTLPIQMNVGLAVAYNSIVFFSFVFAGYGAYLLSLYTLSQLRLPNYNNIRLTAFVGGLIFTLSPFHMAHLLGHMQVFSMMWPPFYILWLLRTLKPWADTPPTRYAGRDIGLSCFFLILATSIDWYHTLYLLLFTGFLFIWTVWRQGVGWNRREGTAQKNKMKHSSTATRVSGFVATLLRPLWPLLTIGFGFALVFSPLLIPMVREAQARPDLQTGLSQNITLSADLLAFFLPSELHPLWGKWAATIANNFTTTTSERLIFAGFLPLGLTLFVVIRQWRRLIVKFWVLVVVAFFLLALGPFLHINGKMLTLGSWPVPMPYLLLYNTIPFIGLTRSLSRYDLMVMLGIGVLTTISLMKLQLLITNDPLPIVKQNRLAVTLVPILVAILICFEFLAVPYPVSKLETPQFYVNLGAEAEDYTIAELPMNWDRPTPLLQQTVHQKRLLTAYTSRDNPLELAWRIPVFQHWRFLEADIIDQPLDQIAPTIFFDFNLRYIVLDFWQMPPGPEREGTERWVAAALPGVAPVYDDGRLKVYQAPPKTVTEPYLSLGEGWGERQAQDTSVSRTLGSSKTQPTELFLHHPQNQPLTLEIAATSDHQQALTLWAAGEPIAILEISETTSSQEIDLPPLSEDLVKLTIETSGSPETVIVRRVSLNAG